MSGEEWRGGGRYGSHGSGSGGSKRWSWWTVESRRGSLTKENEKDSPRRNKDAAAASGGPAGSGMQRFARVWVVSMIALLCLVMIFNNASLIRKHVPSGTKVMAGSSNPVRVIDMDLRQPRHKVVELPEVERKLLKPHPCARFRVAPPPTDPKRSGPRPCPVCYLPEKLAISQIPAPGTYVSPVLKRLSFVLDEHSARPHPPGASGSVFGGYPSLEERARSYEIREEMEVHCGFVNGPTPGKGTGFDFDEDDRDAMHACHGAVVASAIFGNYDLLQQPKKVSREAKKSVCFFMFVDEETEAHLESYDAKYRSTKHVGLWRIVVVRNPPYSDPRRNGKIPKLLLHRLFPFVRFSLWVDGKLELVQDPYPILERFLWRTNQTFAISEHYKRFDVFVEADANKAAAKYSNKSIDSQVDFYKAEGLKPFSIDKLPITSDVPEGCVIIREHTPIANLMSCLWFNEVDRFTARDQLSFAIVRDKLMASATRFMVSMFRDCERRNFVVQGYHRDLLVERGMLPVSNSSSRGTDAKEVKARA